MSFTFAAVDIGASLQQALDSFFAFIPRLIGFLIVLAIGFIVARVVKTVLVKLLEKVGLDSGLNAREALPLPPTSERLGDHP